MWLWLRYKLAAVALIQPLAWEPPYATGAVQKRKKKKKKKFRLRISCYGTIGLAMSLEHWDTGSIPSLTQCVKDLALP